MKLKVIKGKNMANYLLDKNHIMKRIDRDRVNPEFDVYIFVETDRLIQDMVTFSKEYNKNN